MQFFVVLCFCCIVVFCCVVLFCVVLHCGVVGWSVVVLYCVVLCWTELIKTNSDLVDKYKEVYKFFPELVVKNGNAVANKFKQAIENGNQKNKL